MALSTEQKVDHENRPRDPWSVIRDSLIIIMAKRHSPSALARYQADKNKDKVKPIRYISHSASPKTRGCPSSRRCCTSATHWVTTADSSAWNVFVGAIVLVAIFAAFTAYKGFQIVDKSEKQTLWYNENREAILFGQFFRVHENGRWNYWHKEWVNDPSLEKDMYDYFMFEEMKNDK